MERSYTLVWSFRNRIEILKRSILTAHNTTPTNVKFLLVDAQSNNDTILELRRFCSGLSRHIRICETDYRSSLSEAWNLGIMLSSTSHVIFASSDVEFIKNEWFEQIMNAPESAEYILIENHALFCLDKKIIPKIGWFDELFSIGPHFDTDYYIRASEGNLNIYNIPNNDLYKHGHDDIEEENSRKNKIVEDRLPMNDLTNESYFKEKWHSAWIGWTQGWENNPGMLHPPNHISMCQRMFNEVDPHPVFTYKIYERFKT